MTSGGLPGEMELDVMTWTVPARTRKAPVEHIIPP